LSRTPRGTRLPSLEEGCHWSPRRPRHPWAYCMRRGYHNRPIATRKYMTSPALKRPDLIGSSAAGCGSRACGWHSKRCRRSASSSNDLGGCTEAEPDDHTEEEPGGWADPSQRWRWPEGLGKAECCTAGARPAAAWDRN